MQTNLNKQKKETKDAVNISKNKKSDLAKEFQEFKQRIQEFEDKNEEIINRIRQTYSFKKKTIESRNLNPQIPVQAYQRNRPYNDNQSDNSSCDLSQKIVYDGNVINHAGKYRRYQPQFYNQQHYNTNYRHWEDQNIQLPKFQKPIHSTEQLPKRGIHYKEYMRNIDGHKAMTEYQQIQQNEPQYKNYEVNQRTGKFFNEETIQQLENRLQEVLSKNSMLQSQLQAKDEEINRVKALEPKLKNYISNTKKVISESFQNFQEDIIMPRLDEIEKYIKKCINRMKNLAMKLKDQMEERQSYRTIQRSRSRRRLSSKQKEPNSSASSADMKESSVSAPRDLPRPSASRALSNQKNQNKTEITTKQKEFQHIASEYEKMIKSKVHQIEQLQNKLKQEIAQKDKLVNQLKRSNKLLQEKSQLLKNASTAKKFTREEQNQTKQLKELREKVVGFEQTLRQKQDRQKQLVASMQKIQKSKKVLFEQQKQSYNKSLTKKNDHIIQLQQKLKKLENDHFKELNQLKQKLFIGEKQNLEKDVQLMGLANKLKKVEADLLLKDQKLKQLEKLILKQNDQTQLLQKSMSMDNSLISPADLKNMQESLRKLQEQIEQKNSKIYELQRQRQRQSIEIESYWQANEKMSKNVELLQRKIKQMNKEAQSRMLQISEKQSARQLQQKQMLFQEYQEEQKELIQEKQQLLIKNKSLLQDLKKIKQENLGYNREIIKLNSQIAFNKDEFQTLRQRYAKAKQETTEGKAKIAELQSKYQEKQNCYVYEIKSLQDQIKNLTNQILQLQNFNKGEDKDEENLLNSLHVSDVSFNMNNKRYPEEELNALKDRVKQLQTQLEMKQLIQLQMQNEYKSNLQKIRSDAADKNKDLQSYINDIEQLKKQLKIAHQKKQDKVQIENYRISMYKETIVQLQSQYNTSRQSEERLNELLHSLMQNMKEKSEEMNRLTQQLESKDKALQELKQLLQIKGIIKGKDESKQLILRISGQGSQQISDIGEISYMSNISDVFKRDDVLQQRMRKGKTSRQEFVKLFTKTSAYIKTLKQLIQNKDKRIKTLEKQIQSFKTQENRSWCGSNQKQKAIFQFSKTEFFQSKEDDSLEQYKDYESMQIDTRRTKSYELIKELQREKELAVQENKMLLHQIDALQEQLVKAEQQENSLVKIKDLYKEEIKKLMEKNQAHNKQFEIQINKMKRELEASVNFHNWEALKQLSNKMIGCFSALQDVAQKAKRQQRKKQLQEYFKVMGCVLGIETTPRQRGNSGKK